MVRRGSERSRRAGSRCQSSVSGGAVTPAATPAVVLAATAVIAVIAVIVASAAVPPGAGADLIRAGGRPGEVPASQVVIPPAGSILQGLRADHPRLLVTGDTLQPLRDRIATDPASAAMYEQTRARATALLGQPPVVYDKPDGIRLLEVSREAVRRIYDLGLVWLVESDPQFAARGWVELEAVSNFPDWNPLHFLDTAEMTHAVAIGYDWFYDALTPAQRATVAAAIAEKGLEPGRLAYSGQAVLAASYWVVVDHNWNNVVNGGLTIGALAVGDVYPALAAYVAHEALVRLPAALANYAPDGGWPEGVGYWEYATEYTVFVLAALASALGSDFGLSDADGLAATGDVPLHLTGPSGQRFNFADDGEPRSAPAAPFQFWLASRYGRTVLRDYQLPFAGASALDALWYRPGGPLAGQLPLDRLFAGIDVASLRGGWDPVASWVGFKGGDNGYNHNQLDLGHFVFDAEGERWALDLGKDNYNLPGYFQHWPGGARWLYYRNRAEGHNTLVIDPDACEDQDPRARSTITRFETSVGDSLAVADLTNAYRGRPVRRGVWLRNRTALLVQDEIGDGLTGAGPTSGAPADVRWFMHTRAGVELSGDGRTALLTQNGKAVRARLLSPAGVTFRVDDAAPLPSSPHPDVQGANTGVRKLTVQLAATGPVTIAVLIEPDEGAPADDVELTPLAEWHLPSAIDAVERPAVATVPSANACDPTLEPDGHSGEPAARPAVAAPAFTG